MFDKGNILMKQDDLKKKWEFQVIMLKKKQLQIIIRNRNG